MRFNHHPFQPAARKPLHSSSARCANWRGRSNVVTSPCGERPCLELELRVVKIAAPLSLAGAEGADETLRGQGTLSQAADRGTLLARETLLK
jgi:hypothetical protein